MHFAQRLGILVEQCTNSPRLCARKKMRNHSARSEDDRILLIRHLCGRTPIYWIEVSFAVRMVELLIFVKAGSAGMADIGTWPADAVLGVYSIPRYSVVVGNAALGCD